jgi:predicted transcriptional regulator
MRKCLIGGNAPPELHQRVKVIADALDMSMSELVVQAVTDWLDRKIAQIDADGWPSSDA